MSYEKILDGWRENIPPHVPLKDVLSVLENVFEKVEPPRRGSHLKVYDSRFEAIIKAHPRIIDFSYDGRFTIPIFKGNKVKKIYVKRILLVFDLIKEE